MAEVKAKAPKANDGIGAEVTVQYVFGETLAETVDLFGEGTVHSYAVQQMRVACQANVRRLLESGTAPDKIQELISRWKPGVITRLGGGGDPLVAAVAAFEQMSADDQQAYLAKLMEKQAS